MKSSKPNSHDQQLGLGDKPPAKPHRATGKPRGGRRVYNHEGQIEHRHVYSPAIAREILQRMEDGEAVSSICKSRPDFPDARKVRAWKFDIEGFGAAYARARQLQAEAWGDEIIELSRDRETDPSVRRVEFDMRKWMMSKHAPEVYGDRVTLAGDPDAPIVHVHQISDMLATLGPAEIDALERFTEARLQAIEAQAVDVTPEDSETRKK